MTLLQELELVHASVDEGTSVDEAASALHDSGLPAIAVLGEQQRVTGLFTDEQLLRSLFPPYLAELRHTAFAPEEVRAFATHADETRGRPVDEYMQKAVVVEMTDSPTHVAELFLHEGVGAIAVTDAERFVGMLAREAFVRAVETRFRQGINPQAE